MLLLSASLSVLTRGIENVQDLTDSRAQRFIVERTVEREAHVFEYTVGSH